MIIVIIVGFLGFFLGMFFASIAAIGKIKDQEDRIHELETEIAARNPINKEI